jgi:DNA-3-methyladenine glycosylase II
LIAADVSLALNMPRARGAAIRALAAAALADPGLFAPAETLEAAILRFTAIRGIGPWTAQYIAMRALKLPDALPVGDVGLLRALDVGAGRPSAAALLARAEAWRPFRAYAAQHLWAADETVAKRR